MPADSSQVRSLATDLAAAPVRLQAELTPVLLKAGANIKAVMKADASGHRRLGGLPSKVSYDVYRGLVSTSVEVGFDDTGQGELANIAAYGTSTQPPLMDINRGVTKELPAFERFVLAAAVRAL